MFFKGKFIYIYFFKQLANSLNNENSKTKESYKHIHIFQLSLWGGDASFQNLDLRLEVLEEQLNLPFKFVSGHIHELMIHVPWVKINSEPIIVTINTIGKYLLLFKTKGSS